MPVKNLLFKFQFFPRKFMKLIPYTLATGIQDLHGSNSSHFT